MIRMKYISAFEKIKSGLKDANTDKLTGDFAVQVNISNKDSAGAFYVAYFDGVLSVEPYDYRDNWAMITISVADFMKLVSGRLDIEKAIASGKLEVTGDLSKVQELTTLVKAPEKKPAVRKTAAKKPAGKKTAAKPAAAEKPAPKKAAKSAAAEKPEPKKTAKPKTVKSEPVTEKPAPAPKKEAPKASDTAVKKSK